MSEAELPPDTVAFLHVIADELAEIHRAREYCEWRSEAKHRVHHYLSRAAPFSEFVTAWVFMGDGASSFVGGNFGAWAIDRLIEKMAPEDVLALFREEVARNVAVYVDVSPAFGVEITEVCELGDGIRLTPASADMFSPFDYPWRHAWPTMPVGTGYALRHRASAWPWSAPVSGQFRTSPNIAIHQLLSSTQIRHTYQPLQQASCPHTVVSPTGEV